MADDVARQTLSARPSRLEQDLRSRNGIYLIVLLRWFWLLVMLVRAYGDRRPPLVSATPLMRRAAVVLFVPSMLLTGNTWRGVQDLRRAALTYSRALDERWQHLEAAAATR